MKTIMNKTNDVVTENLKKEIYKRIKFVKNPDNFETVSSGFERIEELIKQRYAK